MTDKGSKDNGMNDLNLMWPLGVPVSTPDTESETHSSLTRSTKTRAGGENSSASHPSISRATGSRHFSSHPSVSGPSGSRQGSELDPLTDRSDGPHRFGSEHQGGPDRPTPWHVVRTIVTVFVCLSLGWLAAQGIFMLTGRPPEILAYLIAIILSVLIAGFGAITLAKITGRPPGDSRLRGEELLSALDRISRGDFSVRLDPTPDGPLREVVESVNKMAADLGTMEQNRQEFISNVSHEIQSPLTSISGFATLLREDGLDPAKRRHYVDVITAESERLSTLSGNLLRLSALDDDVTLNLTRFWLDEQLRSVIVMLEPQWSAKQITVEVNADPVEIDADQEMLSLVWINIINNAIKYTPASGRITVTLTHENQYARIQVTDTGIGISPEDLPHVFERFFRADKARSGQGNGLGLSLAKRIAEVHSAHIDVSSQVGKGTTMTVLIPNS